MDITVVRGEDGAYTLSFEGTEVALGEGDLKRLLIQVTKVLLPGAKLGRSVDDRKNDFISKIKTANDVGIQKLIMVAEHEDILVLLKSGEGDEALLQKFYANMSENARKMTVEDLIYKFKEDIPTAKVKASLKRLTRTAEKLGEEGTLVWAG